MRTKIAFIRRDAETIDAMAVIEFTHHHKLDTEEKILAAFKAGVTQWARTSEAGQELWKSSSNDLNIGDLGGVEDRALDYALRDQGILAWEDVFSLTGTNEASYDMALVDADKL